MSVLVKVSGSWRQVNSIHTKINGVWKQVNSAYIKMSSIWRSAHAAGGDRGVIGGGVESYTSISRMEYITISNPGSSTLFGYSHDGSGGYSTATSNGSNGRGIFAFGFRPNGNKSSIISYITISTPGNSTFFGYLTTSMTNEQATSNNTNNRGVFMGGYTNVGSTDLIQYITISTPGNALTFGYLTERTKYGAATSNGTNNRGVYGGGNRYTTGQSCRIDYITISNPGNASYFGNLGSYSPENPAACSNLTNDRGLFGGGNNVSGAEYNTIRYITISTTGNSASFGVLMGKGKYRHTATSNGTRNRGIFWGGWNFNYETYRVNRIEYINIATPSNAYLFGYTRNTGNWGDPGSTSDGS